MTDFDLQMAAAKLAEALLPDDEVRQQKANAVAIAKDGGVSTRSLAGSLPWQRVDVMLPGPVIADTGNARIAMPQGCMIRHVAISARAAPSTTFTMSITSGSNEMSFTLQAGITTQMSGGGMEVTPGSWVLVNVHTAGGAHDVLISIHYSPLSGGS